MTPLNYFLTTNALVVPRSKWFAEDARQLNRVLCVEFAMAYRNVKRTTCVSNGNRKSTNLVGAEIKQNLVNVEMCSCLMDLCFFFKAKTLCLTNSQSAK